MNSKNALIILFIFFILFIYNILSYQHILNKFDRLASLDEKKVISNLVADINNRIKEHKKIVDDYSKWDDTYYFAKNNNTEYVYENFREGSNTITNLGLEFMIFINTNKKIIYSSYNESSIYKNNNIELEEFLLNKFNKKNINIILEYKNSYYYLAKSEILKSDYTGEGQGFIIAAKQVDIKLLKLITNNVKFIKPVFKEYDYALHSIYTKQTNIQIKKTDDNVYYTIDMQFDKDIISIQVNTDRDVFNMWKKVMFSHHTIILVLLFMVFLFILYYIRTQTKEKNYLLQLIFEKEKKEEKHEKILLEQSKLVLIGEMTSSITHQYKQPLHRINGLVNLIHNELTKECVNKVVPYLESIEDNTEYLSHTINDFDNFINPNKEKIVFSLLPVINNTLLLLDTRLVKKEIEINTAGIKDILIFGLEREYMQVLLIILNNAIDAFSQNKINSPIIIFKSEESEKSITLFIEDNAGGIAADVIPNIFNQWFSTKTHKNGTGIGLYIAKIIMEKHMFGQINVKSKNNITEFSIITKRRKG